MDDWSYYLSIYDLDTVFNLHEKKNVKNFSKQTKKEHCSGIIGRNPIEANANTVAIQLQGNPVAYIGKCFTPY